jgi:alkanesulfonate monooxygenase SsuD/methylene tetrahydromethanopterin reductase-like flavin-dependent oxidoreductase (luciferase family)
VPEPAVGFLPARLTGATVDAWRDAVALAEQTGIDHVAVGDHVSFYVGVGQDGLLSAAAVLGASEHVGVNTAIYLLPLRHPVVVARQVADLGALAPGRFRFGVGIGGEDPHEVEICGVDPKTRGRRMDDCLRILRGLLSGDAVDFDSEFFTLQAARIAPTPAQPIPIIVGGRSDAAVRRAGRLGDGWFGLWASPRRYRDAVAAMEAAAAEAGRAAVTWTNALNVWCGVASEAEEARSFLAPAMEAFYQLPFDTFARWSPAGTPRQIAEFLVPYVEAGCSVFNLILNGRDLHSEVEAAAEVRQLILEAVR